MYPTGNPFSRIGIQSLAAFFRDHQGFAELQSHLFIFGDEVGLDDDYHIFAKNHFLRIMSLSGFGLKDRRILVNAVDQIVISAVTAPVNDLRGFFGFGGGGAVLDHPGKNFEGFDGRGVHLLPFRGGPLADRKRPVNLPAVA